MRIKQQGFTLVEVLVVAPILILFIGTFIALLVNLTGESLVIRERNIAIHDTQAALDEIQTNITQATGFFTTTGTLPNPQGSNNSTAAFTDTGINGHDALILSVAATTKSPNDPTRSLIYTGSGACDSKNPIYTYYIIYFVAPDREASGGNALYKRTILPQVAACAAPWQRNSCADRTANTTVCKANDERLVGGIGTFDVKYYTGSVGPRENDAPNATDVSVNLAVNKTVAGSTVNYSGSSKANSQNLQQNDAASTTPPANQAVSVTFIGTEPYRRYVSWGAIGNATSYVMKYRVDGGAEQSKTINAPTTSSFFDAAHRKQTMQLTDITVNTNTGSFSYGSMPPINPIPNWNDCNFQNGWHNYRDKYGGNTFTTGGFTKTSSKIVALKGLVRTDGAIGNTICTLPAGFRPKFANEKLIFQVASANGANWGRVDVLPTGEIVAVQGAGDWVSLDGIMFIADDSTYSWTTLGWQNGWTNYNTMYGGNAHATLRTTVDNQGRRHVQGLGGYSGTTPIGIPMTAPGGAPNRTLHYPAMSGGPGIVQPASGGSVLTRTSATSYQSLQLIYRLAGATGWQNIGYSSNWGSYDINNWPTLQCHRGSDDIVVIQGLVAHNDPADGNGQRMSQNIPCGKFSSGQGYGQAERLIFSPWLSNDTTGRIDMINGEYFLSQGTQDPWTALDGIHYVAD